MCQTFRFSGLALAVFLIATYPAAASAVACNSLLNVGLDVAETQVAADPPIAGAGFIPLGLFYLVQWQVYNGTGGATGPTGNTRKQTRLFSDATHYELVTADNGGVETRASRTYSTAGTTLNSSQTCPVADFVSIDYSVLNNGGTLALISGNIVFTFQADEIFSNGFEGN